MVSAQIDRGCGHAELARDAEDASLLIDVEDWEDRTPLETRIRSERFGALLGLMEACPAAPLLELRFVSETIQEGLDIHDFLKAMGSKVGRVAIFGL
jgi:hypothetical protein